MINMLNAVTWGQFIVGVVGVVCLYYLVLIAFFLKEKVFKERASDPASTDPKQKRIWQVTQATEDATPEQADQDTDRTVHTHNDLQENEEALQEEEKLFDDLTELARRIESAEVSNSGALGKDQLFEKVALELRQFPQLNKAPYRVAIANLVIRKAAMVTSDAVTADEVDALW